MAAEEFEPDVQLSTLGELVQFAVGAGAREPTL